ncbi:DMT family transporter [Microbacterium koreense]|uniref:DMT family transporter n=1 Tax=Microbacterium koreense TaxID=323761 RepID=A0ABW2ZTN5_9MICO
MSLSTAPLPIVRETAVPATRSMSGLIMALTSALAFASSGPFVKPLIEAGWSVGAALLVRMAIAGLVLSPALIRVLRRSPGFLHRHGLFVVGFGVVAVAGIQLFYFSAMSRMPVAVALLLQYLAPVLLVGFVWFRTRRAPSPIVLTGSAVALIGLVLVVDISGARFDLLGTVFGLAAAVCTVAFFVLSARAGDEIPPLALAAGGLLTGAAVIGGLMLIGVLPFAAPMVSVELAGVQVAWFVPLLWVAAVATTLGYAFGVMAVPRIGSRVASFVGLSEVLFALAFAWLFLGEVPAPIQLVGGAVLLVGVVLVRSEADSPGSPRGEAASLPAAPAP